jgi:hypothetical protein
MRGSRTAAHVYSVAQTLLGGVCWLMFAIAGFSFFFGGRLIYVFVRTDRMMGEMGGIGIAVVCAGIGVKAKTKQLKNF